MLELLQEPARDLERKDGAWPTAIPRGEQNAQALCAGSGSSYAQSSAAHYDTTTTAAQRAERKRCFACFPRGRSANTEYDMVGHAWSI